MKIPSKLPQFSNETALFLIAGTEEADFYIASNGEFNAVFNFCLEKIKFSDREDSGRHGTVAFENGSKAEKIKKEERQKFVKTFVAEVKKITSNIKIDLVYLAAPKIIAQELATTLPATLSKKIKKKVAGNYCQEKMLDIYKKFFTI